MTDEPGNPPVDFDANAALAAIKTMWLGLAQA